MPIKQILEMSAMHATPKDLLILDDLSGYGLGVPPRQHPIAVNKTATGFILRWRPLTEERAACARELGFSNYFMDIGVHARHAGCSMVVLDRDAEWEPGLPRFSRAHAETGQYPAAQDYDNDNATPDDVSPTPGM